MVESSLPLLYSSSISLFSAGSWSGFGIALVHTVWYVILQYVGYVRHRLTSFRRPSSNRFAKRTRRISTNSYVDPALGNRQNPNRLHFHQLAMRFLEIRFFGRDRREIANPVATLVLVPLISVPQILGVLFWNNFFATVCCTIVSSLLFVTTYFIGIKIAKVTRTS